MRHSRNREYVKSERKVIMWQFVLGIFVISLCIFVGIMRYEPRTLWSGGSFFCMTICTAFFLLIILYQYSEWLASHDVLIGIMIIFLILAVLCAIAFPGILIIIFLLKEYESLSMKA